MGSYGIACFVNTNEVFCLGQNTVAITNFRQDVDRKFIYYSLINPILKNQIEALVTGSTQKTISMKSIRSFQVPIPSIMEQKARAAILSSLDDKIENNRKTCEKLEEIAQAIFKRWFVDFEFPCLPDGAGKPTFSDGAGKPTFSDGAGKPYDREDLLKVCTYKAVGGLPSPSDTKHFVYVLLCDDESFYIGITNDLYKRWYEHKTGIGAKWTKTHKPVKVIHYEEFTSKEEARKREEELKTGFGRKWLKREYEKLLNQNIGSPAPKTKLRQAGKMVKSEIGMIPEGWNCKKLGEVMKFIKGKKPKQIEEKKFIDSRVYLTIDVLNRNSLLYGSVEKTVRSSKNNSMMVMDGASSGMLFFGQEGIVASTLAKIEADINNISEEFIYSILKFYEKDIKLHTTGSAIPHTDKAYVYRIDFAIPEKGYVMSNFNENLEFIRDKIINCEEASIQLKRARETLLPKLMSGELFVNDKDVK